MLNALKDNVYNQHVLARMGKELEEWRSAAQPIVEYVAPAPVGGGGEEVVSDERSLLDRLRTVPDAMRVVPEADPAPSLPSC